MAIDLSTVKTYNFDIINFNTNVYIIYIEEYITLYSQKNF